LAGTRGSLSIAPGGGAQVQTGIGALTDKEKIRIDQIGSDDVDGTLGAGSGDGVQAVTTPVGSTRRVVDGSVGVGLSGGKLGGVRSDGRSDLGIRSG